MSTRWPARRYAFPALVLGAAIAAVAVLLAGTQGPGRSAAAVPAPVGATAAGFADVVAKALPSVVQIRSPRGLGSGIVFDSAGHIVTNAHVVTGSRRFT